MKEYKVTKSHELAAMLLALPNLPVYRHRDDDENEDTGILENIGIAEKITACDEDGNPTIDCIVLDGFNGNERGAEPPNVES